MLSLFFIASTLSLLAFAQILSLRPQIPSPKSHTLVEHNPEPQHHHLTQQYHHHNHHRHHHKSTADVFDSLDLLDILLLASVDGKFHALNRTSGDILWSMGAPTPSSSNALAPLVRTDHVDYDPDLTDDHELHIIEPQSGIIYVLQNPSSPLQQFPFTMQELVDMSPFSFSGDGDDEYDGRVFVGKKETSLLVVELETGRIKATLNSECPWDQFEEFRRNAGGNGEDEDEELDLDELEGSKPQKPPTTDVYIGRTDYHVSIITRPNPTSSSYRPSTHSAPHLIQNLSFSTYGPNKQDNPLQALYRRTKDNAYTQPLPGGDILSFRARSTVDSSSSLGGNEDQEWKNKHLLWMRSEFTSPMVAVFDILRKKPSTSTSTSTPTSTPRPFVLLQPRPKIQDLIPNLSSTVKVNPLAAYVGLVGSDESSLTSSSNTNANGSGKGSGKGSLFAMSPQNYPLVAFGREVDDDENVDGGVDKNYPLIDSSSSSDAGKEGEEGQAEEDMEDDGEAITVDELTRLRKLREASSSSSTSGSTTTTTSSSSPSAQKNPKRRPQPQCSNPTSSFSSYRHCLVGIRRLSPPPVRSNDNDGSGSGAGGERGGGLDAQTRMERLLDAAPGAMGYEEYRRIFMETHWPLSAGNMGIGDTTQEGGPLTIDPPPPLSLPPPGANGVDEGEGGSVRLGVSMSHTHTGIAVGLKRWETLGMTILVIIVMGMVWGERWWRVVGRHLERKRGVVMKEEEEEEEVKVKEEVKRRMEDLDAVSTVTEEEATVKTESAVVDAGEVSNENILSLPPPTPNTLPSTSVPSTPLIVPPTPIPTAGGDETDREDMIPSDGEDFVLVAEGGSSIPKQTGAGGAFTTPTPDTPTKKKKTRRGKRPAKKPKNANANSAGEVEEAQIEAPTPAIPSSLIVTSTAKPASAPSPSLIVSDTVLGYGSHGTVVYRGSLQGRAVAVKRLLADFVTLASREVSILQESDDHPNVIRYYYQEAHAGFLYIALELCPASLADIVETPDRDQWREIAVNFDPKRALRQVTNGLRHLHGLKLVHRDIKPQNILVTMTKGNHVSSSSIGGGGGAGVGGGVSIDRGKGYRMLISDFGLCKKLEVDQTSFLPTAHGAMAAGTVGWRAPEILSGEVKLNELPDDHSSRGSNATVQGVSSIGSVQSNSSSGGTTGRMRLTKSVDIFALGCLYYYTLTSGGHPYGDRYEREVNIMKNAKNLEMLERFGEEGTEAMDLIEKMLDPLPSGRPDTTSCLLHPFFWDSSRRLNFLQDASDRFEIMCRDPKDPKLLTLEQGAAGILGNDWHTRLDKIFIENLGKFRKYDGKSVQDLLRALRNKKHHYQDLPDNVKRHLGPMPEGFLAYFTRRFPNLFLHVHHVVKETGLAEESMFRGYFELPDS